MRRGRRSQSSQRGQKSQRDQKSARASRGGLLLPLDYAVAAIALGLFASLLLFTARRAEGEARVHIATRSQEYVYALNDTIVLVLDGPVGETEIAIRDGAVQVLRSPGREQICVRKGAISRHGEWLICLPNQIFIRIAADGADNSRAGASRTGDSGADDSAGDAATDEAIDSYSY